MIAIATEKNRTTMNGKPVHQIPAKTVLNMDSGFVHKLLCDGPTFSTGTACTYSCSFCYVPDMMRKQQPYLERQGIHAPHENVVIRREGALETLRRQLTDAKGQPRYLDFDDHRVIYSSPLVDVAGNLELCRETVEACKIICDLTNWQIRLLSKSHLLPEIAKQMPDQYAQRIIYGVSTGTLDDSLARSFEGGTPFVSKRLASLHWLQDHGLRTYGMICPSLPLPDHDYTAFAQSMSEAIRWEKCEHIWGEVINVRGESMTRTLAALRSGGHHAHATEFERVFGSKDAWEDYARATFEAHAAVYRGSAKLRFLQYVTSASKPWWQARVDDGAIML
jgi:DNA repair photolyase